jgi:hypothetical protein
LAVRHPFISLMGDVLVDITRLARRRSVESSLGMFAEEVSIAQKVDALHKYFQVIAGSVEDDGTGLDVIFFFFFGRRITKKTKQKNTKTGLIDMQEFQAALGENLQKGNLLRVFYSTISHRFW